MKKILAVFLVIGTFIILAGSAWAYDYPNSTVVQWYNGSQPSGQGWSSYIGDPNYYRILG